MSIIAGFWRLIGAVDEDIDDNIVEYPTNTRAAAERPEEQTTQRIIDLPAAKSEGTICIFKPQMDAAGQPAYSMKNYANNLLHRQTVIIDVNELAADDLDEATRIVDYLSGVAEAVEGSVFEVSKNIFMFLPNSISLAGDQLKQVEVY
jgi:FtsZ-interacting cell division protein YlmF